MQDGSFNFSRARQRILAVDRSASIRRMIERVLGGGEHEGPAWGGAGSSFDVTTVATLDDAAEHLREARAAARPFAIVFLEISARLLASGADGVLDLIDVDHDVEFVLVAGPDIGSWNEQLERLGPASSRLLLLRKPFEGAELRQLARNLAEKWSLARAVDREGRLLPDGGTFELRQANERLEKEVAERKAAEDRLRYHAFHDALTGLANRSLLLDRLERCISRARREDEYHFAVLFLDIDNFKLINDSLGHDFGDELLIAITKRLQSCLRSLDTVVRREENVAARFGGDEFVVLLEGLHKPSDAALVSERLLEQLSIPVELQGHELVISASIGVAVSESHYTKAETVLRDADIAMYRAKAAGKGRYALFDQEMHVQAMARLQLESDLRRTIEEQGLSLVYQPIVALRTGLLCAFEALVRWEHPERGAMAPDDFIPIAEETGLILPLGRWVLNEACRQLRCWDDVAPDGPRLSINVNLSRRQLLDTSVYDEVKSVLEAHGLTGDRLSLEITESAFIEDAEAATEQLEQIRRLGVKIHMDDFGTGYSSLSCLHRFPLDVVKIDRAFMATMGRDRSYAVIIDGIVTIAHNLSMKVNVEGVETQDQLAQILALDCDFAQGYLFSSPVTAAKATAAITDQRNWRMSA